MNQRILIVSAILVAATVAGRAAAIGSPAMEVVVFPNLTPAQASTALSSAQRLVWDRQTGIAVAEVPQAHLEALAGLNEESRTEESSPADFDAVVSRLMPNFREDLPGSIRYAMKEPMTLVRPPWAPSDLAARDEASGASACLSEDFETLPIWKEDGGDWRHYQGCQYGGAGCSIANDAGDYFWLDTPCDSFSGQWDVEAVMGGSKGKNLPCGAAYPAHTDSWLDYWPAITCLYGSPEAGLFAAFKTLTYDTGNDFLFYGFSTDGTNYSGYTYSGNYSDSWYGLVGDLTNWPRLGDLTTYSKVYLAFVFQSGAYRGPGFGARLDNIIVSPTSLAAVPLPDTREGHPPLVVNFHGAVIGGNAPFTYSWDFGDGGSLSSDQNPSHTYQDVGAYTVHLTVTDSSGAASTGDVAIAVTPVVPPQVMSMVKATAPFRLVALGANLDPQIKVYISGTLWSNVVWKSAGKVVIKGGASLKSAVPKGVPTTLLFENRDGLTTTYTFTW